jgi:hypothetical protein
MNRRRLRLDNRCSQKERDQGELKAESQLTRENLHVDDTPLWVEIAAVPLLTAIILPGIQPSRHTVKRIAVPT